MFQRSCGHCVHSVSAALFHHLELLKNSTIHPEPTFTNPALPPLCGVFSLLIVTPALSCLGWLPVTLTRVVRMCSQCTDITVYQRLVTSSAVGFPLKDTLMSHWTRIEQEFFRDVCYFLNSNCTAHFFMTVLNTSRDRWQQVDGDLLRFYSPSLSSLEILHKYIK